MRYLSIFIAILQFNFLAAQITEDFSDGDFTSNPAWTGTTSEFIINGQNKLQLNNSVAGTSYLSTAHGLTNLDDKEWKFWTKQSFSPSGSNFGRIYLTANNSDLSTNPDGFYLQLGESGSGDAIRLIKRNGGTNTELIAGTAGNIATSFEIGIRILRDNSGNWELYVDYAGGENYALEGTATDATNLLGTHFGMLATYTSSNATKFYYNNIYVGDEIVDVIPPSIVSATVVNQNLIDLEMSEAITTATGENPSNYDLQPFQSFSSAQIDPSNPALIHLTPLNPLTNGMQYNFIVSNLEDLNGNTMGTEQIYVSYLVAEIPQKGDIIINEFMCDETPAVGLPKVEFVELYNRSSKIFNVENWKLADASSQGTMQNGWILPNEYIVLTRTSDVDSFPEATAVTSFPSLNNSEDAITIFDENGNLLDSIYYTKDWYNDSEKDDGGWTLERINPNDPCSDQSNWSASISPNGGTPKTQNSIFSNLPDTEVPQITQLLASSPNYLKITYSEGMDSTSLKDATFSFSPPLTVNNNFVLSTFPTEQTLQFQENLIPSQNYTIEFSSPADCWLNSTTLNGVFALPDVAENGDVIINEILFNPVTGGQDFIELYNNSTKLIDLKGWSLANYNDSIANIKEIEEHYLLPPNGYVVITKDSTHITQHYPNYQPNSFIEMTLPSYPNDSGTVYLLRHTGLGMVVTEQVSYDEDWHFPLLDDVDGVSLERINPNRLANDKNNWHSAAENIGFATPGLKNSQYFPNEGQGEFAYANEVISPDNDGFEDVLKVNYEFTASGYVGSFSVYNDQGVLVAKVLESELLSNRGTFIWDGVMDNGNKASIGVYIGVFEAFNLDGGKILAKKKAFTVAGKL